MLIIEKDSNVKLPKKFHIANNICAYMYDHLTEVLTDPYYSQMRETPIEFGKDEAFKQAVKENKVHILDSLKTFNKTAKIENVLVKHLVMSIISDMTSFIYESIKISQKGKMSVSFALVRKPFTDQLLILEQILVDKTDFINRFFYNGNPQDYDPSSNKINKIQIIEAAILKLNMPIFQPNFIHELRYDKSSKLSINWISNHALHIVTTDKNYKTEDQNFNFVFSAPNDINSYWEHYFLTVPMLLIYTASIVDKIIFEIIEDEHHRKEMKQLQRLTGLLMAFDEVQEKKTSAPIFRLFSKATITECGICKHTNRFKKADFKLFFYEEIFLCSKCFNPLNLSEESFFKLSKILG
jgi:hypothetical protein